MESVSHPDISLKNMTVPGGELLRVGSLNLLNQHAHLQGRLDGLIAEIERLDLDVLLLQEVLEHSEPDTATYIAEHTRLNFSHAAPPKKANEGSYGNRILSRKKLVEKGDERFHVVFAGNRAAIPTAYAAIEFNGRKVHIFNVHLTWGSDSEPLRMHQAEIITGWAQAIRLKDPEAIILLGGDLNAQPQSSTFRYLTGQQSGDHGLGTLWVDAWSMWGTDSNLITSDPETYWGGKTGARKSGLYNLELVPKRRIDYLLAYDWVYGKEGSPMSFQRFADELTGDEREISDHFGIMSDFWVPLVEKPEVTTIKVTAQEVRAARIEVQAMRSAGLTPDPLVVQLSEAGSDAHADS